MTEITSASVFNVIRTINDPEHPKTLEQLEVVQEGLITVKGNHVKLTFTPTIPHCSMATLIGLCIRVKLERNLPPNTKFDVSITPGTHAQEQQVSKQLRDKERVSAALENPNLLHVVEKCIEESNISNPLFFNPDASCGNTTGTTAEENKANPHAHQHGDECCGGHGNNNKNEKNTEGSCCQSGDSGKKEGDQCCQGDKSDDQPHQSQKKHEEQQDECCGGNGNNDSCCQSK